jgi:hypothetical protein
MGHHTCHQQSTCIVMSLQVSAALTCTVMCTVPASTNGLPECNRQAITYRITQNQPPLRIRVAILNRDASTCAQNIQGPEGGRV